MSDFPNWFVGTPERLFNQYLSPLAMNKLTMLQIGTYTGDATTWIMENALKNKESILHDVDTWEGSDEPKHHELNWVSVEETYDSRVSKNSQVIKHKETSDEFFKSNVELFDFIYIDGDHTSYGVLKDAVNAFEALKINGILAFDDYLWTGAIAEIDRPKLAVDAFLEIYSNKIQVLTKEYQVWVKRIA